MSNRIQSRGHRCNRFQISDHWCVCYTYKLQAIIVTSNKPKDRLWNILYLKRL
ncbi:hypothetical protein HanPSC8_Chr03g0131291 [Helianthus annuus]|nr:hypothetical protein HanPSC8_Chr03g0131291 [Helianthus annuus]